MSSEMSPPEVETSKRSTPSLLASVLEGAWPKAVIIAFVIELIILFIDSSQPLPQGLIQSITHQNGQISQAMQSTGLLGRTIFLFSHNFNIASLELLPLYGWFIFWSSIFYTAQAIEVVGISQGVSGADVTFSLLLQPHTWLELPAYAMAVTQSVFLISSVFRRKMAFEISRTLFVWMLVAGELLIAAIFEASEITTRASLGSLAFDFAWIAFAFLAVILFVARRRYLSHYHRANIGSSGTNNSKSFSLVQDRPHLYDTITVLPNPSQNQLQKEQPPSKYCPNCGATVGSSTASYCDRCGRKLT